MAKPLKVYVVSCPNEDSLGADAALWVFSNAEACKTLVERLERSGFSPTWAPVVVQAAVA